MLPHLAPKLRTILARLDPQARAHTRALELSEARLQAFIRYAPSAITFKGLDGRVLLLNPRAEALLGLNQAQALGRRQEELFPPELAEHFREQDERVLALREAVQTEEALTLPGGTVREYLITRFPLLDGAERCWGLGAIATDITERKEAERSNLQHHKMAALSLLAGGISHDFNNLMGGVIGNLELARMELAEDSPVLNRLEAIEDLTSRASELIEQLLAYAGRGTFRLETLDLNGQVETLIRLLRSSLAGRAALIWEPGAGLPPMVGRLAQIQQAVVNLVLNAVEAVPTEGGRITLRTGLIDLAGSRPDGLVRGQVLRPGRYLTLEVADNGRGMTPQIQERIFEPFFSTKVTGRGLGLAAVAGILRSHLGGIEVTSAVGKGSAFKLLFPAQAEGARPAAPPAGPEAVGILGTGTVLVVDDEDAVRELAVGALHLMGFDTLEARDGLEGLQVFQANRDRIRLVLMNFIMPGMNGDEAFLAMRQAGLEAPIILSSGFGQEEEALHRFKELGPAGFLQRPYRMQAFKAVVSAALGQPARPGAVS